MTPLQLYRKHPEADAYSLNGGEVYTPYAYLARGKRVSDAELAATYYMVHSTLMQFLGYNGKPGSPEDLRAKDAQRRLAIIERFATLPHYDQDTP